ncbi:crotonobetaine/carnitine--CoA ligase [Haloferula helveola]
MFRGMDIAWLGGQWVDREPEKTFLIWAPFEGEERRWSYAEFASDANRFAAGLHDRGIGAGDFVLVHLENCPELLIAWFGCAILGAVPVTTNSRAVPADVRYFAEVMRPVAAVTQPSFAAMVREACGDATCMIMTESQPPTDGPTQGPEEFGAEPFSQFCSDSPLPDLPRDPARDFSVQFTSGTTSRPRPTVWTHANALWCGRSMAMSMRLRREDATLVYMPLFHANAQVALLTTLWSGGTVVLQPKFSASRFWDTCARYGVTWASMIPFAFKALQGRPVPEHRVRVLMSLARLPDPEREFGVETIGYWGMTETVASAIIADADHVGPPGTMGRPSPFYGIEVRKEDGSPAGPGEQGLLFIHGERGVSLFKQYYHNPEATEDAFDANGALDTGDMVRIDEDGWFFFVGRDKDMLRVGGENVAASEIERVITESGLVEECAVVAQKHHMLGDVPAAFVILNDAGKALPEADLIEKITAYCRENLADFKVTRSVQVVDELPRTTLDKVAKNQLRDRLPPIDAD